MTTRVRIENLGPELIHVYDEFPEQLQYGKQPPPREITPNNYSEFTVYSSKSLKIVEVKVIPNL